MIDVLEPTKDIALAITENPALAILDSQKFEAFYEKIKAETENVTSDATTNKGRDEIRSMAFKVAKTRTAIDKARLGLTEGWRTKTKQANEAGAQIKARLEALEEKVRAPLTAWEEAEKIRAEKHEQVLRFLSQSAQVEIDDNSKTIADRINDVLNCEISPDVHGIAIDIVKDEKARTLSALNIALERAKLEEAERAELERFRKEAAEREAIEAEKRAKEEAEAKAEADRLAEAERLERIRQEAAESARLEAERAHAAALAIERERADKIERQAKEEAERRKKEAEKEEADRLAREQDREHRGKIMGAAKVAIMECGVDEDKARNIVLAIAAGNIPAISIKF